MLSENSDDDRELTYQHLAQHVAVLEAFPYHSKEFHFRELVEDGLSSSQAIQEYLHRVLAPQAQQGDKLIVTLRVNWHWQMEVGESIIVYPSHLAQSASLDTQHKMVTQVLFNSLLTASPKLPNVAING